MGKISTSASFYGRGIPNSFHTFGAIAQGNFVIVQPSNIFLHQNKKNIFKNYISNIISRKN